MKQQEKTLLKQKNNYKQIEEEKEVKSQQEIVQPKIFNLSKKTLSRYQVNILLGGLKFKPTPKRNIIQLKSDIHNYTRKLRLTEFFTMHLKIRIYKIFLKQNPISQHLEIETGI